MDELKGKLSGFCNLMLAVVILILAFFSFVNNGQTVKADSIIMNNADINKMIDFRQHLNAGLAPKTANSNIMPKDSMPTTGVVTEDMLNWPSNGDFALADDPNVKPTKEFPEGGKIAYVRNAKQLVHAIYGSGTNYETMYLADDATTGRKSDITKIVLVKDIDIVNELAKDPDITVVNPQTGSKTTLNFNAFTSEAERIAGANPTNSPTHAKYTGQDGRDINLTIERPISEEDAAKDYLNNLVIDGNGHHYINAGNFYITTKSPNDSKGNPVNMTVTFQDVVIYGSSYWGIIRGAQYNNDSNHWTKEIFRDVDYYGSQFLWSQYYVDIETYGTINAFSLRTYIGPDNKTYTCQGTYGGSGQQNIQAHNITFGQDCVYNGYTYAGNALELSGNATLDSGATVNLYPHRGLSKTNSINIGTENWWNYYTAGLYLLGPSAKITMGKNSNLNFNVNTKSIAEYINDNPKLDKRVIDSTDEIMNNGYGATASAILMSQAGSLIQYVKNSNANINIDSDGPLTLSLIRLAGGTADIGEGSMKITAKNLGSSNVNLLTIGNPAMVFVNKNGAFQIDAKGATGPVNLVYNDSGTFTINVYKPKLLKLEKPNDRSNLIYGTGNVEMHGIKATTTGTANGETTPNTMLDKVPFQYINLPFQGTNLVTAANNTNLKAQTSQNNMSSLGTMVNKLAINTSTFREFDSINVTALDNGPELDNKPIEIDPQSRTISGEVTTQDSNVAMPDARIHVFLQRKNGNTTQDIDLGQAGNSKITPGTDDIRDAVDPGSTLLDPNIAHYKATPVEPDNFTWFEDSKNDLYKRTRPGTLLTEPWKYVTDSDLIKWNGNTFTINIDDLLANYNKKNPANKINALSSTDRLKVEAVKNYQASNVRSITPSSLHLDVDKTKPKKTYVLGDDIQIPLQYVDIDGTITKLNVNGYVDPAANSLVTYKPYNDKRAISIQPSSVNNEVTATIPASEGVTQKTGQHTYKFYGLDDQGSQSPAFDLDSKNQLPVDNLLQYDYEVVNLPGYAGTKQLLNNKNVVKADNSTGIKQNIRLGMGSYTEKNVFTAKSKQAGIKNFTFSRGDNADLDSASVKLGKLQVVINDGSKQQTKEIEYGKRYTASDFGYSNNEFPLNTTFEVDQKLQITDPQKDLNLAPVQMATNFDHNGTAEDINLGTSNNLTIGTIYLLRLTIPQTIDFGTHVVGKIADKTYDIYNKDQVKSNLRLEYTPIANNNMNVSLQLADELRDSKNNAWSGALVYKAPRAGSTTQTLSPTDVVSVYTPAVPTADSSTPVIGDFGSTWWDKDNKQVAGLFLKTNSTSPHWGHYHTAIDWTVTNSI